MNSRYKYSFIIPHRSNWKKVMVPVMHAMLVWLRLMANGLSLLMPTIFSKRVCLIS